MSMVNVSALRVQYTVSTGQWPMSRCLRITSCVSSHGHGRSFHSAFVLFHTAVAAAYPRYPVVDGCVINSEWSPLVVVRLDGRHSEKKKKGVSSPRAHNVLNRSVRTPS